MTNEATQPKIPEDYIVIPVYDGSDMRMLHWTKHWSLSAGGRIGCTKCAATQPASKNYEPFVHQDICPNWAWRDQYPWANLREILSDLPMEEFQWPIGTLTAV